MLRSITIVLLYLASVFFPVHSQTHEKPKQSNSLLFFEFLDIEFFPQTQPVQIAAEFIMPDSVYLFSTKQKNDSGYFMDINEVALVLQNRASLQEITNFYDKAIPSQDYKILQKDSTQKKNIILAEGSGKTNLAVIITDMGEIRKIKILFKKPLLFE